MKIPFKIISLLLYLNLLCTCNDSKLDKKQVKMVNEAQALFRNKKFDLSRKITNDLYKDSPENVEISVLHAKIDFFTKNFENAEITLKQSLEYNPHNPYLLSWLGRTIAVDSKRQSEAAEYFKSILKQDPENYMAYYYLGRCLESDNQLKPAMLAYQNALRMERNISRINLHMGHLFFRLKLNERSLKHLEKVENLAISKKDMAIANKLKERVRIEIQE